MSQIPIYLANYVISISIDLVSIDVCTGLLTIILSSGLSTEN